MTQKDRVLTCLRTVGARGLTQVDFLRYPTIDGGPPVTRLAARVEELRAEGHAIVGGGIRGRCKVYLLDEPTGAVEAVRQTPEALFDAPPSPPRNALDDEGWAA